MALISVVDALALVWCLRSSTRRGAAKAGTARENGSTFVSPRSGSIKSQARHGWSIGGSTVENADISHFAKGLTSRRWLFENLLCLLWVLCLLPLCGEVLYKLFTTPLNKGVTLNALEQAVLDPAFVSSYFPHVLRSGLGQRIVLGGAVVSQLLLALYSSILTRLLGDFAPSVEDIPRTALPELRPARFNVYFKLLQTRMGPLRWWWMLHAILCCVFAAPVLSSLLSPLLSSLLSSPLTYKSVMAALSTPVLISDALMSVPRYCGLLLLPLALGACGGYSVLKCSARDVQARRTHRQAQWVWAAGSVGIHQAQTLPLRMRKTASNGPATPLSAYLLPERNGTPASQASFFAATPTSIATPLPPSGRSALHATPETVVDSEAATHAVPRRFPDSTRLIPGKPLRIVILTIGTRGDVQPFIALATSMKEAGHDVTISSTSDFKGMVEKYGLHFHDTGVPRIDQPAAWLTVTSVADMIRSSVPSIIGPFDRTAREFYKACYTPVKCDVVIGTAMTITFALSIAEALSVPVWIAKLAPDIISCGFTGPGSTVSKIGWVNKAKCYKYWLSVAKAANDIGISKKENDFRVNDLKIPELKPTQRIDDLWYTPQLLGYSRYLFPKPLDYPEWAFQTGFWQISESGEYDRVAPPKLKAFLTSRRAEVAVVTFGSMILQARELLLADIVAELLAAGFRVLLLTGWSETLPGVPSHEENPNVLIWKEAPHDWVFEHAALVVHHGGAGTTSRALASGIPSVIIPVLRFADQMQWGQLVHDFKVGTLIRKANPQRSDIAAAIRYVRRGDTHRAPFSASIIRDTANTMGSLVGAETSAETALSLLESCLCNLVLSPSDADAIHPLAGPINWDSLSKEQRMCVRNCIPCRCLRSTLQLADTSLFRVKPAGGAGATPYEPTPAPTPATPAPPAFTVSPTTSRKLEFSLQEDAAKAAQKGGNRRRRRPSTD